MNTWLKAESKHQKQSLDSFNTASNTLLLSLPNPEYHKDLIKRGKGVFAYADSRDILSRMERLEDSLNAE